LHIAADQRLSDHRPAADVEQLDVEPVAVEDSMVVSDPERSHGTADRAIGNPDRRG
jgi:hypothetical protein